MKRLRIKQGVKDILGLGLFLIVIVGGLLLLVNEADKEKSVDEYTPTQYTNAN